MKDKNNCNFTLTIPTSNLLPVTRHARSSSARHRIALTTQYVLCSRSGGEWGELENVRKKKRRRNVILKRHSLSTFPLSAFVKRKRKSWWLAQGEVPKMCVCVCPLSDVWSMNKSGLCPSSCLRRNRHTEN